MMLILPSKGTNSSVKTTPLYYILYCTLIT